MGWSPPPAREVKLQQGLREGPPIRAKVKEAWFDVGRDQEVGGRAEVVCRLCRPHIHLCCGGVPAQHARPSVVLRLICWHEAFRSSLTMLPQEVLAA